MKYKRLIFTLLTGLLFNNILFSLDTVSTKFIPLKIGNVWNYCRTGGWPPYAPPIYYKCIVQRDTIITGHRYYYLSNPEHFIPSGTIGGWFRVDSSSGKLINFRFNACGNSNYYSMDSLSSGLNDSSIICSNDTFLIRKLLSINNNTRWGVPTIEIGFNGNSGPAGSFRTYSKFLGLSFSSYGEHIPLTFNLMGCVIDGVLFGDTNTFVGIYQISSEIPEKFDLSQNYPNPFNPVTKIKFDISGTKVAQTILSVYDLLGREITVLVNQQLQPGSYETEWDASAYPSGVYYYKLESGSFVETKKMVLIK